VKRLPLVSDFALGVLLIGGAPLCGLFLGGTLENGIRKFSGPDLSEGMDLTSFVFTLLLALVAFALAVRHRFKRRLMPRWTIPLEIALGIVGAFFMMGWYALLVHFIID
jgi:drug/metabolite transporter (DMT)-like permease